MTSQYLTETRVSQPPTLAKRSDESTTVPENVLDIAGLTVDIATPRGTLHVVRDVSLHVKRGETLCIVGESGCGKSMTSLAIMGLLPKSAKRSSARFEFLGEELSQASKSHVNDCIVYCIYFYYYFHRNSNNMINEDPQITRSQCFCFVAGPFIQCFKYDN